jgi:hypothetical protein
MLFVLVGVSRWCQPPHVVLTRVAPPPCGTSCVGPRYCPRVQIFVRALFGVIGLVNLIQVVVGRQLVGPTRSRRMGGQLRWESAATALVGVGGVIMAVSKRWGFAVIVLGVVAQELVRRIARRK